MTDFTKFPFSSLNNDDLLSLSAQHGATLTLDNHDKSNYDTHIRNFMDNNTADLNYNFDSNDQCGQLVTSHYFTEQHFRSFITSDSAEKNLFLLHLNIRSASKNFDNLKLFLDNNQFPKSSFIGLTETWFSDNPCPLFSLPNFNLIVNNRTKRPGGGVALYIPQQYDYTLIANMTISNDVLETLFVEIRNPKGKNLMLGVFYRPPHSNTNAFLETLNEILLNPLLKNKDCFFMGDFNINLVNCNSNNTSQEFLEMFLSYSFLPLITKPTRVTNNSATIIDNIFSNITRQTPKAGIILSDISDHFPIFVKLSMNKSVNKETSNTPFRKITDDNITNLINNLDTTDWSTVLTPRTQTMHTTVLLPY